MPLFIICSGFFYKKRKTKEEIKQILNKNIIPYMFFLLIYNIFLFITKNGINKKHFLIGYLKSFLLSYSYGEKLQIYNNV